MAKVPMVSISMTVLKPFTLISSAEACKVAVCSDFMTLMELPSGVLMYFSVSCLLGQLAQHWSAICSCHRLSTALPLTKPPMKGTLCSWEDTY